MTLEDVSQVIQPDVLVKQRWADDWIPLPHLIPLNAAIALWPERSTAKLLWRYGVIGYADQPDVTVQAKSTGLLNWFVKIQQWGAFSEMPGMPENSMFAGIIRSVVDDATGTGQGQITTPTGNQTFEAWGFESILDMSCVDGAYIGADAVDDHIHSAPPFNLMAAGDEIVGNRSTSKVTAPNGNEAYHFSDDGQIWTAKDVIEYLLAFFGPKDVPFSLAGQVDNLASLQKVWAPPRTVKAGISQIISRQRGAVARVKLSESELSNPELVVYSTFDEDVSFGGAVLTANNSIEQIDLTTAFVENFSIKKDQNATYERIIIRGGPLVVCGSADVGSGTLEKGWSDAIETEYKAASDEDRKRKKYEHVYTTLELSGDTWFFNGGSLPRVKDNGNIDLETAPPDILKIGRSLLPALPLLAGYDYSTTPPSKDDETRQQQYLRPMLFCSFDGNYYPLNKSANNDGTEGKLNIGMEILEGRMAFRMAIETNHWLALGHWSGAADSGDIPYIDYSSIITTLAVATDQRLRIVEKLPGFDRTDCPRTLTLDVPDAELWFLTEDTALDVKDGELVTSGAEKVIRDDRARLATLAATVKAWFGKERNSAVITWRDFETFYEPGSLLTKCTETDRVHKVNSIISRVEWNFETATTKLSTDFAELDFVGLTRG